MRNQRLIDVDDTFMELNNDLDVNFELLCKAKLWTRMKRISSLKHVYVGDKHFFRAASVLIMKIVSIAHDYGGIRREMNKKKNDKKQMEHWIRNFDLKE